MTAPDLPPVEALSRLPGIIRIDSMTGVEVFLDFVADALGAGFHPDTPFTEYVEHRRRLFNVEEARGLDALLSASFAVCDHAGVDLYGLVLRKWRERGLIP